jgi:phage shock protein A
MGQRLVDRITTLFRADAHGVVEALEERSLLLKQYVREAELELDRKRARLEAVREEEKRLREALERREAERVALDEDVGLALAGGKEDLARFAIRRLIPCRRVVQALRAEVAERAEEGRVLAERVEVQEAQLEGLRTRVRAALARPADPERPGGWLAEPAVADEEVELELLRRRTAGGGEP